MVRDLKFRAKTTITGEYVIGFYLERMLDDGNHSYIFDGKYEHEIDSNTVEQFSGIIKNGEKIYAMTVRFGLEAAIEKAYNKSVKEILRELYTEKGLTQVQIAEQLNVGGSTISKWLKKYKLTAKRPPWDKGLTMEQRQQVKELLVDKPEKE